MKLNTLLIGTAVALTALTSCGSEKSGDGQVDNAKESMKDSTEEAAETVTYKIDASSSKVTWKGGKVFSEEGHNGTIGIKSGNALVTSNKLTGGEIVIDMNAISVLDITPEQGSAALVGHLTGSGKNQDGTPQTNDFFNTAEYPTASFVITEVNDEAIVGDLTIKGKTLTYKAPSKVTVEGDMVTIDGTLVFDRSKFDVGFGTAKGLGVSAFDDLVGDVKNYAIKNEIEIGLNLVAKK